MSSLSLIGLGCSSDITGFKVSSNGWSEGALLHYISVLPKKKKSSFLILLPEAKIPTLCTNRALLILEKLQEVEMTTVNFTKWKYLNK